MTDTATVRTTETATETVTDADKRKRLEKRVAQLEKELTQADEKYRSSQGDIECMLDLLNTLHWYGGFCDHCGLLQHESDMRSCAKCEKTYCCGNLEENWGTCQWCAKKQKLSESTHEQGTDTKE